MATPEAKKIIQCTCGTKLSVPLSASRVMCPKCKQPLQIAPARPSPPSPISASPPMPPAPMPPAPPPVPTGWFVALGKTKLGPLPRKDVADMLANGRLQPSDMVLPPGTSRWTPAHSVEDLRPVTTPRSSPKTSKKWLLIGGIAGASFLLVGIVLFLLLRGGDSDPIAKAPDIIPGKPVEPGEKKEDDKLPVVPALKKPDAPAVKPGEPLDTAYIAPDFHAAFVVSPRRFLESKLAKAMPGEMLREPEAALGMELRNLEQVVVVLDHIKPEVVVVKKEAVKDDWILIDSREGGFQARFPAEPKTSDRKTLASTRKVWTLEQEDGAIEYEVSYGDFSKDFEGLPPQSLLDAATRGLEFKPGFKERKDIKQGKIPGAEVVIDDKELRTFAVHRIFVVGNRSYHASATVKGKPAPPEFARFLDSLQVTQTAPAVGGGDKLFPPELQPAMGAILRFRAAVDDAALLKRWFPDAVPGDLDGKAVSRSKTGGGLGVPTTIHVVNKQTLLIAPEPMLKKMFTADGTGPLADKLKRLDASSDLAAVLLLRPYQDMIANMAKLLGGGVPPPWNEGVSVAHKVDSVQASVNFRGKTILALTVEGKDEATARTLERLGREAMLLASKSGPPWQPFLHHPAIPPALRTELEALSQQLVTDLDLSTAGSRLEARLSRPARPSIAALLANFEPKAPKDKEEIDLGGEVADVCVGGGGKYLCYLLRDRNRVAIFDVTKGSIVKQIDVDASALIAAGAKQLAVVSRSKKEVTLWNFAAFDQDKTLSLPTPLSTEDIGYIAMGEASAGPLYFYSPGAKRTSALDLPKGTVRPVNWSSWSPTNSYGPLDLRVSPDGQTILGHGGGWAGLELIRFDGTRQTEITSKFNFSLGAFANLSADGQRVFLPGETVDRAGIKNGVPGYLVPAREPGYFLGLKMSLPPSPRFTGGVIPGTQEVTLYAEPASRLAVLEGLPELKEGTKIAWDKQIHWYPRTGLLVTLANKNKVVLRHIDLPQQIEKAGRDYLLAHFRPIAAKVGQPLSHKLDIRSKRGGLDFKLDKGPDGMKVSPAGEVQWTVPPDFPDSDALALITIRDAAGQETTARLRIWIGDE